MMLYISLHVFILQRFWNIIGEKEVCAVWRPNEEFCHIVVDTGIFDHHMPDSIQGAVERLYHHQIVGKEKLPDVKATIPSNGSISVIRQRAQTVGAALDRQQPNKDNRLEKDKQFLRSVSVPDGLRESQDMCTVDDDKPRPVCQLDNTIIPADVNEATIQVIVHVPPQGSEGGNKLALNENTTSL